MASPYEEGREARYCGMHLSQNPYPRNSDAWTSWRYGFVDEDVRLATERRAKLHVAKSVQNLKEFMKEEQQMSLPFKGTIQTVDCVFQHDLRPELGYYHNPKKKYCYLTDDMSIKEGDIVVVDAPSTGYTCVKVVGVHPYIEKPRATKWVVGKVDVEGFEAGQKRRARIQQLMNQLDTAVEDYKRRIKYEEIAERDPTVKELLEELNKFAAGNGE